MERVRLNEAPSDRPQILTRPLYLRDDPTRVAGYESIDFESGAVIERCGRLYMIMPDGSQRRIKHGEIHVKNRKG